MAVAWTETHVDLAGVSLHLARAGSGSPLLLISGTAVQMLATRSVASVSYMDTMLRLLLLTA